MDSGQWTRPSCCIEMHDISADVVISTYFRSNVEQSEVVDEFFVHIKEKLNQIQKRSHGVMCIQTVIGSVYTVRSQCLHI